MLGPTEDDPCDVPKSSNDGTEENADRISERCAGVWH